MARGLLGDFNRIVKKAAREAAKQQRAAQRDRQAAVRRAQMARKAEERASAQLARATQQERKHLEKEARESHIAARLALVEEKNAELNEIYDEIDTLLEATLAIDDFVDLESLKSTVTHPPFGRPDLEQPIPRPVSLPQPSEPVLNLPPPPTGLASLFGKKRHERAVTSAKANHEKAMALWKITKTRNKAAHEEALESHQHREAQRLKALETEKERYAAECSARVEDVGQRNAEVDQLIADLGYGVPEAIEEYVSIVLGDSVYPEHFPVKHEFSFDQSTAELELRVFIPPPETIPTIKGYKYTKSKDEINSTNLSQKACKDRYAAAVQNVALRSLHEVFEADRRGLIQTVSLEVGTETTDPATGIHKFIPFVATGAEREMFLQFDLSAVIPLATLKHLGASVSKNPSALEAAETSGIRKS